MENHRQISNQTNHQTTQPTEERTALVRDNNPDAVPSQCGSHPRFPIPLVLIPNSPLAGQLIRIPRLPAAL